MGFCIRLARLAKAGCWYLLALMARLLPQARKRTARPVLLLLRPDAIGDYILFRPWLGWLRRVSPWADWRIVLVGNAAWKDLCLELDSAYFDEALWSERRRLLKNPFSFFCQARRIRRISPELLLYPVNSREFLGDLLVRASRAKRAIAAESDGINLASSLARLSDRWYTRLVPVASCGFELYRTRHFFAELCAEEKVDFPPDSRINPGALCGQAATGAGREVLLFPGAGDPRRRWPAEYWSQVAEFCIGYGWQVCVCGSREEGALCQEIATSSGGESLAGVLGWKELVLRVARARLVLCHDSMALHLAAACSVPLVCISNGNHYGRFLPYPQELLFTRARFVYPMEVAQSADPEAQFARGSTLGINSIQPSEVSALVREILAETADNDKRGP